MKLNIATQVGHIGYRNSENSVLQSKTKSRLRGKITRQVQKLILITCNAYTINYRVKIARSLCNYARQCAGDAISCARDGFSCALDNFSRDVPSRAPYITDFYTTKDLRSNAYLLVVQQAEKNETTGHYGIFSSHHLLLML